MAPAEGGSAVAQDASESLLQQPYQMGPFALSNRIVLAPLTRCRAIGGKPHPAHAKYYEQRAHGNFLISEATIISDRASGYLEVPGIYTEEQVEAWKPVTAAVKAKGSTFFCQTWHVGRISHPDYQPNGEPAISSTNRPAYGPIYTPKGAYQLQESTPPRALTTEEVPEIVEQFRVAARNAIRAGFDGVEIHGAHGYIIDQFLKDGINDRTDKYGGSIENRCRFCLEVLKASIEEIGADRVGIRLSPWAEYYGTSDSDPVALFNYLLPEIEKLGPLFIHMVEPRLDAANEIVPYNEARASNKAFRKLFSRTYIAAGGLNKEEGEQLLRDDLADLICYGRLYLANPDLPKRFALNAPLNKYDRNTFYTQDWVVGYTDYPTLEESKAKETAEA